MNAQIAKDKRKPKPKPKRVVVRATPRRTPSPDARDSSRTPKPSSTPQRPAFFKPLPVRPKRKRVGALRGLGLEALYNVPGGWGDFIDIVAGSNREKRQALEHTSDFWVGKSLTNAAQGQGGNPWVVALEAAMLPIPGKGIPSLGTKILRGAFGAKEAAQAVKAGQGVRGARAALDKPLRTPIKGASSRPAALVAAGARKLGLPDPVQRFIANDPEAKRFFRAGDATTWIPHRRSRLGKLVTGAADVARPVTGKLPLVKNPDQMFSKAWEKELAHELRKSMAAEVLVERAVPRGLIRRAKPEDFYALRMMGKGISPARAVAQHKQWAAEAQDAGDVVAARLHEEHAAQFAKAAQYVAEDPKTGALSFTDAAPKWVPRAFHRIENAAQGREQMLQGLDLLSDSQAALRIKKEELLYHGARYRDTEQYVQQAIQNDPTRQAMLEFLTEAVPEDAEAIIANIDALARAHLERETKTLVRALENAQTKAAEGGPNAQQFTELAQILERRLAEGVSPAKFYENFSFERGFPEEVRKAMVEKYGNEVTFKLQDIGHPFSFDEKTVARNLKRRMNLKPMEHANERFLDANGLPVVGRITLDEMEKRILLATPDAAQRAHDAAFYGDLEHVLGHVFDDKEIMAWLASQVGAAPSRGVLDLMKVMDRINKDVEIGPTDIGLAAKAMEAILKGESGLSKGAKAKISDFIDSALGMESRNWMGYDPRGGRPAVADRWGARAVGLVDGPGAPQIKARWGVDVNPDMNAGLSEIQYEQVAKQYEDLTDHLNAKNFDGRSDWSPAEIQAVDWAAIQRYWGVEPEDLHFALDANTRRIDFELTQGVSGLGNDLTLDQAGQVARAMEPEMRRIVGSVPGLRTRQIGFGVSGWEGSLNASAHIELLGLREDVEQAMTRLAKAFDQELVQASRYTTSNQTGLTKSAIEISAPEFEDPAVAGEFFRRLYEKDSRLEGFMPGKIGSEPAIVIRTTHGVVSPKTSPALLSRYEKVVREVEEEMGLDVGYRSSNVELLIGGQKGAEAATSRAGSVGGAVLDDPLAAEVRGKLEAAIEAARRGEVPAAGEGAVGGLAGDQAAGRADDLALRLESAKPGEPGAAGLGDDVGAEAGIVGERLAAGLAGYREAALQLESHTVPMEFLRELVANTELSHYEKLAVGQHLDSITGGALRDLAPMLEDRIPGVSVLFPTRMALKGLYDSGKHSMYVGSTAEAMTVWHELAHMMQFEHVFPPDFMMGIEHFLKIRNGEWSSQNLEDMAHLMEGFILGYNPAGSKLPLELRETLVAMRDHLLKSDAIDKDNARYIGEGDRALPQEIVDAVEGLMEYQRFTGRGFHGAKGYKGRGKVYMPENRGLPVSFTRPWSSMKTYATSFGSMLRRGQASHLRARDPHLEKEFTGSLIRSGRFKADVTRGTAEVQMKAARINSMAEVRTKALQIAEGLPEGGRRPQNIDDIAVPVDLELWKKPKRVKDPATGEMVKVGGPQSQDIRLMHDLLSSLDAAGKISGRQVSGLDMDVIEGAWDTAFMGLTKRSEKETQDLAAELIDGVTGPIDNVVWVPRKLLEDTGMFDPPDYRKLWKNSWARGTVWGIDAVNDYMKANILLFNPAYYPMNMVGNGVMLLMQQGALAPLNVMRAAKAHFDLGDEAFLIDHHMGGGLVAPATLSSAIVGGKTSALMQDVANLIVDRYPRRAAFIYEARKLGFRNTEALKALLTDPQYSDQLRIAADKAKTAMVDFDDLSSFEKRILSRAIFVYPWLKGATVWTARYPFEHPVQAMAFAMLYAYQQDMLDEELPGGHPYYLDNFIPLGERDGMPWGVSGRQLFTATTPIDIGKDLYGAALDREGQPLAELLNPIYGELVKQATGYDTFTHKEVPTGVVAGLNRMFNPQETAPVAKAIEKARRSPEERKADNQSRLYVTTATEDWLNVFGGSVFGTRAVNPEVAQKVAHRGPQTAEARVDDWAAKAEKALGRPVPEQIKKLKYGRTRYSKILADLKKELGKDKLADNEILAARAQAMGEVYPDRADDAARWREQALKLSPEAAKEYLDDFAGYLGWDQLNEFEKAVDQMEQARG